jgi:hypothetical protein
MLLRRADDAERLVERFSRCFRDHRDALRVEHSVADLVRQRVYGLALGYEDQSDHDTLRLDPLLAAMVGRRDTGIRCRTPLRWFSGRKYRSKSARSALAGRADSCSAVLLRHSLLENHRSGVRHRMEDHSMPIIWKYWTRLFFSAINSLLILRCSGPS